KDLANEKSQQNLYFALALTSILDMHIVTYISVSSSLPFMKGKFSTQEVAGVAHVHRDNLLRWLREGRIPEPSRDRNVCRIFSPKEVNVVVRYAEGDQRDTPSMIREAPVKDYASPVTKLRELNWDFADASTGYLTHSLHPYPAKFIPQIPNALIQELSSVGDTVL